MDKLIVIDYKNKPDLKSFGRKKRIEIVEELNDHVGKIAVRLEDMTFFKVLSNRDNIKPYLRHARSEAKTGTVLDLRVAKEIVRQLNQNTIQFPKEHLSMRIEGNIILALGTVLTVNGTQVVPGIWKNGEWRLRAVPVNKISNDMLWSFFRKGRSWAL